MQQGSESPLLDQRGGNNLNAAATAIESQTNIEKKRSKKEQKKGTKQVLVTLSDSPLLQEHKVNCMLATIMSQIISEGASSCHSPNVYTTLIMPMK